MLTDTARHSGRILPAVMVTTCWRECFAQRYGNLIKRLQEISVVSIPTRSRRNMRIVNRKSRKRSGLALSDGAPATFAR